ncbi:Oligopeptide transport ATP-binding protein OppD [Vibrio stylophorae]|uniref:ABC-type dipeptide transporter n=2 Tax=Vibrio stylophorae TaxID=659351 RepID=A0ABM8ZV57_9VIBR|nr:Oligopeptide transport ATP-binding protein OppD [Vibrio stylophorae]
MSDVILAVKSLTTQFQTEQGLLTVVDDLSFELRAGETLGIVGESGCGKSVTAMSILGLLPQPYGRVSGGEILFQGQDLLKASAQQRYQLRGNRIAMIFQDPMTALNPVQTIGQQLAEVFELHRSDVAKPKVKAASIALLEKVGITEPAARLLVYPHQLSGGMRQRVMIAMALACRPDILIADEPTTALDVTIQAQILELIQSLQQETGMAVIFITHDLGVVAEMCDQVLVMYAGKAVEQTDVFTLFDFPRHPYTKGLHAAMPSISQTAKSKLLTIEGQVPPLHAMPKGCRFANRCQYVSAQCEQSPQMQWQQQHGVACWHWQEI